MKRCPKCNRAESDDSLAFCRTDGIRLVSDGSFVSEGAGTLRFDSAPITGETETRILPTGEMPGRPTAPTTVIGGRQPYGDTQGLIKPKPRKAVVLVVAALAVVTVAAAAFYFTRKDSTAIESVAVLPFENRSNDADAEYLSDGLAESLIYRLSQLPNLKVSPTSSVFRYKGKETDTIKVGNELGVQAVVSGRVVQRGESLTISVEMVDVRDNKLLWGEQYERKMSELLATQREIAAAITQKMQLKLSGGEKGLTKKYTNNNEAYQLYLKARFHFAKRSKEALLRSIELFREAIKLDPNFALAHVGVAESFAVMPSYPYMSPAEAVPQSKAAVAKALEIDPELPEAHAVAGMNAATYDWDWAEAERRFKRALELDPNLGSTHFRYGWTYLSPLGRHDEAIAEMRRAMELEPLSLQQGANFAAVLVYARQFDAALEQARKTYELDPNHIGSRFWMCHTLNTKGMYAESLSISEKFLTTDALLLAHAGYAYAKSGQRRKAEAVIERWREAEKTKYVMSYRVAATYAALGEKDAAFAELEKAYQARDWFLPRLKTDPFLDSLRSDPRFAELIRKVGLPQ